jgi:acylphosphatase
MRLVFHGRVQGVGFRFMSVTLARPRGLTGWVKNEFDGTVSMEVQGSGAQINTLVEELHHQRFIRISQVDSERISVDTHETSFREMQ